jgi:serine/threonine protein kinase
MNLENCPGKQLQTIKILTYGNCKIYDTGGDFILKSFSKGQVNEYNILKLLNSSLVKTDSEKRKGQENIIKFYSVYKLEEPSSIVRTHNINNYFFCFEKAKCDLSILFSPSLVLPFEVKLWIISQIIEGLLFLKINNVAHLDLKPQNIVIDSTGGKVKILDFGISRTLSEEDFDKFYNIGTAGYIAPELENQVGLRDSADYLKCDVYSLGKLILRLIASSCDKG